MFLWGGGEKLSKASIETSRKDSVSAENLGGNHAIFT